MPRDVVEKVLDKVCSKITIETSLTPTRRSRRIATTENICSKSQSARSKKGPSSSKHEHTSTASSPRRSKRVSDTPVEKVNPNQRQLEPLSRETNEELSHGYALGSSDMLEEAKGKTKQPFIQLRYRLTIIFRYKFTRL